MRKSEVFILFLRKKSKVNMLEDFMLK